MQFPTILYKCPGEHQRPGGTYSYRAAIDEESRAALISKGWSDTLPEAIEAAKPKPVVIAPVVEEPPPPPPPDDNLPPTRAEMEEKAKELGITFDGRTSDAKLSRLIVRALEDKAD